MLELHPYLDLEYKQVSNSSRSMTFNFGNQHSLITFLIILLMISLKRQYLIRNKNTSLIFELQTKDSTYFKVPLKVQRYFLWNTSFINFNYKTKCIAYNYNMSHCFMLMTTHALTIHSMCNIHVGGYLIAIIDPSSTLES